MIASIALGFGLICEPVLIDSIAHTAQRTLLPSTMIAISIIICSQKYAIYKPLSHS